ncbi:hypothetical protein LCGC14_2518680 [marine sediment metagenome]|uniref:Uncharacterized protein n=1 Tax=marine sediment metagenome TaxID=412755 RepID=A0A0F9BK02_9ZZZZ
MNTDEAVARIMKVIEHYHEQAADPTVPFGPEQEDAALRAILKAVLDELIRLLVREVVKDVMECLSQQKPMDMN